jgi:hypothetical protein
MTTTNKFKYLVQNIYGINGESRHKTAGAAYRACLKREGDGWRVFDSESGDPVDIIFDGYEYRVI